MIGAHTPGPWAQGVGASDVVYSNNGGKRRLIAHVAHQDGAEDFDYAECGANAALIAAAPAMLLALERLSAAALARDNVMGDPCALLAAKAELADANRAACEVIAQARGQS